MLKKTIEKLFGTHSDHELKKIKPIIDKIEALDAEYAAKTDDELRAKTEELKAAGGVCQRSRGGLACDRRKLLPCPAHRRRDPPSGPDCRDENR